MKRLSSLLFSVLLSTSTLAATDPLQPNFETELTPSVKQFLVDCSGIDNNGPQSEMVAFVACMSLVRGLVDGHLLTMKGYELRKRSYEQLTEQKAPPIGFGPMWCVPNMSNGQLFTSVLSWVDANEKEVGYIRKEIKGSTPQAMAVVFTALRFSFPCQK